MDVKNFEVSDGRRHSFSHEVNEGMLVHSSETPDLQKMLAITYSDIDIVSANNYYPSGCQRCQHFFRGSTIPQNLFNRDI